MGHESSELITLPSDEVERRFFLRCFSRDPKQIHGGKFHDDRTKDKSFHSQWGVNALSRREYRSLSAS